MSSHPLISVVVVCWNPGPQLRVALDSIWAQRPDPPEIVVVDGASSDGSREWLESQGARLSILISEPDTGVYAAMNRGVAAARGDWVLFLGSDDRLASAQTLAEAELWLRPSRGDVVAGGVEYDDGRTYRFAPRPRVRAGNFLPHQGAFYRRSLFAAYGGFDASLALMADYDINLRLWLKGVAFEPIRLRVAACGVGGLSDSGRWVGYAEEIRVRHRHFPAWQCWLWDAGAVARFLWKRIVVRRRSRSQLPPKPRSSPASPNR